jgi:leader peptidase (prepilin peptidase)/N-methyltransferase
MLNFFLDFGPMIYFGIVAFIFGAMLGSFMNVVVARLPYEKSTFWPGSRCGKCLQPIRLYDNIPLLSYWVLRGRCRTCKAGFSIQYFLVELFVAVAFAGVLAIEIGHNVNHVPGLADAARDLNFRFLAVSNWPYFAFFLHRAILIWLLMAAALCDLENRHIPLFITLPGTAIGLMFAICFPWPWPSGVEQALPVLRHGATDWWLVAPVDMQKSGLYPWPAWGPMPSWAPAGSWKLGLLTGLMGAATGTFLLRAVRFLAQRGLGREPMGLGDADLMMMVGAFLGWQPVVVAFLFGGVITLMLSLPALFLKGKREWPFGPGLALGTVVTWMSWDKLAPFIHVLFFQKWLVIIFFGGCGAITFFVMFLFGTVQTSGGRQPPVDPAQPRPDSPLSPESPEEKPS